MHSETSPSTSSFNICEHGVYSPVGAQGITCHKCLEAEKTPISKEQARINILEWLYTHDGGYSNKLKWREDFIYMLKWNLERIKEDADK